MAEKKKVLIAEDTKMHMQFLRGYLITQGFEIDGAEDGLKAWQMFQAKDYDLVLSDMEMPNMNGMELLKAIKKESKRTSVPVVMLTTVEDQDTIARAKALGAVDYLIKPFNQEKIDGALKKIGWK